MPKMKSHKGLLKRIRVTGRKKVVFHASNAGHLRSVKGAKRLMSYRKKRVAKRGDMRRLQKLLHMRLKPVDEIREAPKAEAKK